METILKQKILEYDHNQDENADISAYVNEGGVCRDDPSENNVALVFNWPDELLMLICSHKPLILIQMMKQTGSMNN